MIGREYSHVFPPKPPPLARPARAGAGNPELSWTDRLRDISLPLRAGEVVGLGGLDGQGQRELLLGLFGVLRGVSGEMLIDGRPAASPARASPRARTFGMALIPEDRKTEGLMLPMSVRDNLSFAALDRLSRGGIIDRGGRAQGRGAR